MAKKHNERCKDCKKVVESLLNVIYGQVIVNYNLNLPSKVEDYIGTNIEKELKKIHSILQNHRGHKAFVNAKKTPKRRLFCSKPGFYCRV